MSKKLVIANWKMNPQSITEAQALLKSTIASAKQLKNTEVVVCAPFPYLALLSKSITTKKVSLGAQSVSAQSEGAYTAEVSAKMLASTKVRYVIVGHSERRGMGETNEIVNTKIKQALTAKLIPVLCVGESIRDAHGEYLAFIKKQIHECFEGISKAAAQQIVIAYEPVWAIGKNATREATAEEFTEIKIFIRKVLSDMYTAPLAHRTQILYGGSVHPENSLAFIQADADGFLVGRDSLTPRKFSAIINTADKK